MTENARTASFRSFRSRVLSLCRALCDDRANALVELAVVLALLGVPLFLGTTYIAVITINDIEIANAAHAGALYGMRSNIFAADSTDIIAAARLEAPHFGTSLSVTPTFYFACSNAVDGTHYATQALADPACNGGSSHSLEFVKVVVSGAVTPIGRVPGLPATVNLTGVSVMEVQE